MTRETTSREPAQSLLAAYRGMLTIRRFEERCLQLSADGLVAGSMHLCGGQEAIPVGARMALRDDDRALATYRGHGWALAWGVPARSLLAEICHRAEGVNGGRGGSAYLTAPEWSFLGENSIVGAGLPIACGVAFAAKHVGSGRVTIASIGDGAMNQGAVHEGMAFAAALQLPLIVVVENNGWSELTPIAQTTRVDDLAVRAAGYGFTGEVVDGNDPVAVADAVAEAAGRCRRGEGPALLECKTVRLMGHYNRDIEHYRTDDEREQDRARDPLPLLRERLLAAGAREAELDELEQAVQSTIDETAEWALSLPEPDPATAREHVYSSSRPLRLPSSRPEERELTFWQALNEALGELLDAVPELVVYGEDVGNAGGIFGVTRGLQKRFGADRVFDTPISESAILGSALGAALEGMKPVVEIMWADFVLVALDQLVNQAANTSYLNRSRLAASLVVRMQQGVTPGSCAQHSQSLEALLAHIPGLRVGLPSTPQDAYSMLRAAVASPDPCVLIEARGLYQNKGLVSTGGEVEAVAGARLRTEGSHVGIITWGSAAPRAVEAADRLAGEGIDASVLDLRWLSPIDDAAIDRLVEACHGRVVIVHEANRTGGFGAEIAARISERCFGSLAAPIERVAAPDVRIPAAPNLQSALIPDVDDIVERTRALVARGVTLPA